VALSASGERKYKNRDHQPNRNRFFHVFFLSVLLCCCLLTRHGINCYNSQENYTILAFQMQESKLSSNPPPDEQINRSGFHPSGSRKY
ncbi:MAG: hypothetical protein Q3989_09005, partial [Eubacteriales bacterium]|nr:hypothetical protein [Eubacteriales bacterium]